MVNLANPDESEERRRRRQERREASADVSRSDSGGTEETSEDSRESEVSISEAARVVATEIYSNGLHHREVAEKYSISMDTVIWLMKEKGIGFHQRDQGEPPEYVKAVIENLKR